MAGSRCRHDGRVAAALGVSKSPIREYSKRWRSAIYRHGWTAAERLLRCTKPVSCGARGQRKMPLMLPDAEGLNQLAAFLEDYGVLVMLGNGTPVMPAVAWFLHDHDVVVPRRDGGWTFPGVWLCRHRCTETISPPLADPDWLLSRAYRKSSMPSIKGMTLITGLSLYTMRFARWICNAKVQQ